MFASKKDGTIPLIIRNKRLLAMSATSIILNRIRPNQIAKGTTHWNLNESINFVKLF
jgi:hypothetical protein